MIIAEGIYSKKNNIKKNYTLAFHLKTAISIFGVIDFLGEERKRKMQNPASLKMYEIAKHLNDLNPRGEVKRFANEKGYANILKIKPGCSLWFHHCNDNTLTVSVMVSHAAERRYSLECKESVEKFANFYRGDVTIDDWTHSIDENWQQHKIYVDLTDKTTEEILEQIERLKTSFSKK